MATCFSSYWENPHTQLWKTEWETSQGIEYIDIQPTQMEETWENVKNNITEYSMSATQHGVCHMLSLTDLTTFLACVSENIQWELATWLVF